MPKSATWELLPMKLDEPKISAREAFSAMMEELMGRKEEVSSSENLPELTESPKEKTTPTPAKFWD